MIESTPKVRAAVALTLLAVPYLVLFATGSIWLFQSHKLLLWAVGSLAFTAVGLWMLRGLRHSVQPPRVEPDPSWPPQNTSAWREVEELAAAIEAEDPPLDRPEQFVALVRRVIDPVARHFHPQAAEPWLETPVPDVLRIVELVARDLRKAALAYVPGTHILTIGDLRRLQRLAGMARRTYFWYRVASFVVNAPAAFMREARDALFGCFQNLSIGGAKRWAIGYFVRRTGFYAIQLYGRQLSLEDGPAGGAVLRDSRRDAADESQRSAALDREPLRIMVVGQTKAGKSSLINALFGEHRAATDVVPRTDQVEPYVLRRDGMEQAIILDTAGYDLAGSDPRGLARQLRPWIDRARDCDIVLCACSAATAAREADRCFLSALRAEFQQHPDRHMPVIVIAMTHIDRLRPVQEWSPPYRLDQKDCAKARQIADAVEAVASDLSVPLADVIPVCTLPERIYNIDEALAPAILAALPAAERVKYVRCLRQRRDEQYWQRLGQQALAAGRVLGKWIAR